MDFIKLFNFQNKYLGAVGNNLRSILYDWPDIHELFIRQKDKNLLATAQRPMMTTTTNKLEDNMTY